MEPTERFERTQIRFLDHILRILFISHQPSGQIVRGVEVGDVYGNMIAVTKGLQLGERVVTTGSTLVKDGDQLRIIP